MWVISHKTFILRSTWLILQLNDWTTRQSCSIHPSASSGSGRALLSLKRNNPRGDDGGMSFMEAQCLITGLPPADSLSLGSNGRWGKNDSLAWIRAYKQWFNCWETSRISGAPYETDEMGDILKNKGLIVLCSKTKQKRYCYSKQCCVVFVFRCRKKLQQASVLRWTGKEKTDFIDWLRKKTQTLRISVRGCVMFCFWLLRPILLTKAGKNVAQSDDFWWLLLWHLDGRVSLDLHSICLVADAPLLGTFWTP